MCINQNEKLSSAELQKSCFTSVMICEADSAELFTVMVLNNDGWVELDRPVDRYSAEVLECKLWHCVQKSDKHRFDVNSPLQHYVTKVEVLVGMQTFVSSRVVRAHSVEAAKRKALIYQANSYVGVGVHWDDGTLYDQYGAIAFTLKDIQPVTSQADLNVLTAYGF